MKKKNTLLVILFAISSFCGAQKAGLASINQNDLKSYMLFFSSDEMGGRETGTNMNDAAALYIRSNLIRLGVKAPSGEPDYYQKMALTSTRIDTRNSGLDITNAQGQALYSTDSLVSLSRPSNNLDLKGKLVFAGYGYENKETGYSDLDGTDLKDKILLIMTRTPDLVKSNEKGAPIDERLEGPKIMSMVTKGAKAILIAFDPANKVSDAYIARLAEMISSNEVSFSDSKQPSMPVLIAIVTRYTADMLLRSSGKNLKQKQDEIASTGKPASEELQNISVSVRIYLERKNFTAPNVIGIIEGSDPSLKNECVIYTAHFDHTGTSDDGRIFNGADDNASGSMALLEVAEAFMKEKKKPLRTIVFAWMNGEEKGLLGSRYYTNNPAFPLDKTLADINLDMVGRSKTPADTGKLMGIEMNVTGPNQIMLYTAHESSELLGITNSEASKIGISVKDMGKDIEAGSSDHAPFMEKGVPALMFHSGIHADLHAEGDDFEKIDFDKMEKVSKMVFLIGYRVASQKKRIVVDNPYKKGN